MIRPPALRSRCGSAARTSVTAGRRRRRYALSSASGSASSAPPGGGPPPFQTRTSRPPKRSTAVATACSSVSVVCHVTDDGDSAEPRRVPIELVGAAREENDVRAFLRQRLGTSEPEPGRRAADERGAALQSEIHGGTLTTEATLTVEHLARHPARVVRAQPRDEAGGVVRLAPTSRRRPVPGAIPSR